METYIGMVLGGTNLTIGEMDIDGNILQMKRYKSSFFNQESAFDIMSESFADYKKRVEFVGSPVALGVGLIGRVDSQRGIWQQIDPDRSQPIAMADKLSEVSGLPCFIDNDVKGSARAVQRWGIGQNSQDFIYIYIGTGIAASIVTEGHQIRGSHFNAGEVGHLRVGVQVGIKCPCGRFDCVEAIASSTGIDRCARFLSSQYQTRLVIPSEYERVNIKDVFRLYREGDPLCVKLIDNAADALANLIMDLVRVSDPDTIVLGGEMVADGFLLDLIKSKLHPITMRFVTNGVILTKLNPQLINLQGAGAVAIAGYQEA